MATFGLPMIGWLLGMNVLNFIDQILIQALLGSRSVGIYASNYSLANKALPLIFAPIVQAAHPIVMNIWDGGNHERVRQTVTQLTRYYLLFGAPITTLVALYGEPMSSLVLSQQYEVGYLVIPFVAVSVFIWNLAMFVHKGLEVTDKTHLMLAGVVFASVINVALNIVLIREYGYLGASIATFLSFAGYLLFVLVIVEWVLPWRPPLRTGRNILIGLLPTTLTVLTTYTLLGRTPLAMFVSLVPSLLLYFVTLHLLNEFDPQELEQIRETLIRGVHRE